MKRVVIAGIAAAGIATLGALGGCEIVSVTALNLVETTKFTVDGETLYMQGEINSKTDEQFEEIIAENPQIKTIVECIVPGSLDDDTMIPLSYRVRELGLNTHLTSTSDIASGGVDFFLAGVERSMEEGAKIGVHSWSDGTRDAKDYPRDASEHDANSKYIADMLGDDAFYWFTIYAAPADDIYYMTSAEVAQYGMVNATSDRTYDCPAD
jgi:beta-lactamase class D